MFRTGLLSLALMAAALMPAQAQEKDCDKAKMSCAEGGSYDPVTKTCIKATS